MFLGIYLYTCGFKDPGVTFISHGVGTASVLSTLHLLVELVTAGLIHNAYVNGDLGRIGKSRGLRWNLVYELREDGTSC